MWAIISTANQLKFYSPLDNHFVQFVNLQFKVNEFGHLTRDVDEHDFVVNQLISMGIYIFVNKKDAREYAISEKLTGFEYLKLSPKIIGHVHTNV